MNIDTNSPNFRAGVEAERERIRAIFEHDLAAELPAEAIKIALQTDMCDVTAFMALRREANKAPSERTGVEIHDWQFSGEREANGGLTADRSNYTPSQRGAAPVEDIMKAVNAEAREGRV